MSILVTALGNRPVRFSFSVTSPKLLLRTSVTTSHFMCSWHLSFFLSESCGMDTSDELAGRKDYFSPRSCSQTIKCLKLKFCVQVHFVTRTMPIYFLGDCCRFTVDLLGYNSSCLMPGCMTHCREGNKARRLFQQRESGRLFQYTPAGCVACWSCAEDPQWQLSIIQIFANKLRMCSGMHCSQSFISLGSGCNSVMVSLPSKAARQHVFLVLSVCVCHCPCNKWKTTDQKSTWQNQHMCCDEPNKSSDFWFHLTLASDLEIYFRIFEWKNCL